MGDGRMKQTELEQIQTKWLTEIMATPFVQGIRTGDLSQASRDYYVAQDAHYVGHFEVLLAQTMQQLPPTLRRRAAVTADEADAHLGLQPSERYQQIDPAPHNLAYLAHLDQTVQLGDPLASMLALLPCTESYGLIAQKLAQAGVTPGGYTDWVAYYVGDAYQSAVTWSWATVAQLLQQSQSATIDYAGIYATSYQHELTFWQMAEN